MSMPIRVNSQSGKGGMAYLLQTEYGLELPRRLQIDFARKVQRHTDGSGAEVTAEQLWELFTTTYTSTDTDECPDTPVDVLAVTHQSIERGTARTTVAYLEYRTEQSVAWAAGIAESPTAATAAAMVAAARHGATARGTLSGAGLA